MGDLQLSEPNTCQRLVTRCPERCIWDINARVVLHFHEADWDSWKKTKNLIPHERHGRFGICDGIHRANSLFPEPCIFMVVNLNLFPPFHDLLGMCILITVGLVSVFSFSNAPSLLKVWVYSLVSMLSIQQKRSP